MQLTGSQVLTNFAALSTISRGELPILLSYKIAMTLRALRTEAEVLEELRMRLVKKHAETDEHGQPMVKESNYVIKNVEAVESELKPLFDKKIDIALQPLDLSEFGTDSKLSPNLLIILLDSGILVNGKA